MHFCTGCGNMYYIRITDDNKIVYYCRNCGNVDSNMTVENVVVSNTVFTQTVSNGGGATIINKYTKLDPTLPRISTIQCPNLECPCNKNHNPSQYKDRTSFALDNEEIPEEAEPAIMDESVPREVIYLRYDDVNMKYVYLCAICNMVWNTERI
ncbi:MAG: hypothetical protein FJX80_02175 [Bacteroidetes bacterium]|nr:hypothetical protein [Bacteroidota bacterium]